MRSKKRRVTSQKLLFEVNFANRQQAFRASEWCYGLKVQCGKLCSSEKLECASSQKCKGAIYAFTENDWHLNLSTDEAVFFYRNGSDLAVCNETFTNPTLLHHLKEGALYISEKGVGTFCTTNQYHPALKVCQKGFDNLALSKERVFGVDGDRLYLSDWEYINREMRYIVLPTPCIAIATLGEEMFAFGESIYKIQFNDYLPDSKVTCAFRTAELVVPKSVASGSGGILFVTKSGHLCVLSHDKIRRIDDSFCIDNPENCITTTAGNNYFLKIPANGERPDCLLELDGSTCEIVANHIIGVSSLHGGGRLAAVDNDGAVYTKSSQKYQEGFWQSKLTDFDLPFQRKHLRSLTVKTASDIDVHIVTECERRILHIRGSQNVQKLPLFGTFKQMRVEVFTQGEEVAIDFLEVEAEASAVEVQYG